MNSVIITFRLVLVVDSRFSTFSRDQHTDCSVSLSLFRTSMVRLAIEVCQSCRCCRRFNTISSNANLDWHLSSQHTFDSDFSRPMYLWTTRIDETFESTDLFRLHPNRSYRSLPFNYLCVDHLPIGESTDTDHKHFPSKFDHLNFAHLSDSLR